MNLALAWHRAIDLALLGGTLAALILIQSSIILAAGLLFARALSGRGAAAQSACYRITLVAAMLAPCAAALIGGRLFPRLSISLPAWQHPTAVTDRERMSETPSRLMASAVDDHAVIHEELPSQLPTAPRSAEKPRTTPTHSNVQSTQAADPPAATRAADETAWRDWAAAAFLVAWTSVALILVARLCGAVVSATRLSRGANDAEPDLAGRCRQLAAKLHVRAPAVRRSPFVSSACVFGWRRPVMLLAESDTDVADDVLIHELAHLVRHDCFWKFLARLAAAIFWFQPLLWWLNARLQQSAEEACDDFVVQFGFDRGNYAGRLAQIAQRYVPNAVPAAVGIVTFRSALGRRVSRILDSSRQIETKVGRKTRVGLLAGAVAIVMIAGLIDIGRPQPSVAAVPPSAESGPSGKPPAVPPSTPAPTAKKLPAQEENETQITIRGQVLKPDGQPAAGAKVFALRNYPTSRVPWRPLATAITGPTGEFKMRVVSPPRLEGMVGVGMSIAARADGFGMQWMRWGGRRQADASAKPVLHLVPESEVHGRVVNWDGKPMRDVRVKVLDLSAPRDGNDIGTWLEAVKSGENRAAYRRRGLTLPTNDDESQPPLVTDQEGRFVLRGIGAERIARVELRGETMAYAQFDVVTRKIEPITFKSERDPPDQVFGSDFSYQASATRPVVGTVRDAATGKPLAGVRIESQRLAGIMTNPHDVLATQTDVRGAYRLVGFPKGTGTDWATTSILTVLPNDEQPYFLHHAKVPNPPGNGPVTLDFNLTRGLWITGQVTDKVTGKPVPAYVTYFPFLSNPFAIKAPDFKEGFVTGVNYNIHDTHLTRPDGTFRIVGLPGSGIVAASAMRPNYRKGVGAYNIPGMARDGSFATYRSPANASAKREDALKLINPAEGADSVRCDFVLDPGGAIRIAIVDSTGKPVERCRILYARKEAGYVQSAAFGSTFEMTGMLPNESRTFWVSKAERNIGKILSVSYDDRSPRDLKVTLEPCATVKGRVVDNAGRPRKRLEIIARAEGLGESLQLHGLGNSDKDGRFEFSSLPTGCKHYTLEAYDYDLGEWTFADAKVQVTPGQTIDLGTIKLKPRE